MDNKASENVTPNLPKPLPTISTLNWTGEISHEDAKAAFECGVSNLERMKSKPGIPDWLRSFDPVKGHRPDDPEVFGSSRFLNKEAWNPSILHESPGRFEMHPGHGGAEKALVFTASAPVPVGKWYPLEARMRVVVRKVHGTLQPVLEKPEPVPTNLVTFVLTNEGPEDGWVLASVYPGTPDPDPAPEAAELKEGEEITLEKAAELGLRVKA